MKKHPIAANRADATSELRYNLFRRRWQPDLCCAVPEDRPVPSFVTGERWDFRGYLGGSDTSARVECDRRGAHCSPQRLSPLSVRQPS